MPSWLDARSPHRAWLLAAAGLYLACAVSVISTRTYWPRYDSALYISAATAVSRGVGLRDITSPVTRPAESWAHVPTWVRRSPEKMDRPDWPFFGQYPPVMPFVLSPFVVLGGGRFLVLQAVPLMAGLGTLVLVYRWRDTLFPGPWPLTLLISAGSMLTLYATRVQTEAVHALFVLATLRVLARAGENPARLARWATVAALVLLLGIAVHIRLVFLAAGAAFWLLVGPRAPLGRRVWAAMVFAALTVVPPTVFTFSATWADPADLRLAGDSWTLGHNPYFWTEGWNASAPLVDHTSAARIVTKRTMAAGRFLWNGLSAGSLYVQPDAGALALLAAAALVAVPWWRHRSGLLAFPTLAYLAAVVLSPWTESRMSVPVLPIVAHGLAVAFARIPALLGVDGERPVRQALLAAGALILATQAHNWQQLTPQLDEYALEYWQHGTTLAYARLAAEVPADRVVIAPLDTAAFAVVTGRPTQSFSPIEWKESDPRVFLASGGAPLILGPLMKKEYLEGAAAVSGELAAVAGPRTRQIVAFSSDYGLIAEWVRVPPPPAGSVSPEPLVPGRIHPRWLRLTPADREPLAHAAIPDRPR
jgi:hypothetical protein